MKTFNFLICSIISIGFVFGSFAGNRTWAWANSSDPLDNWHVRDTPVSNQLRAVTYDNNSVAIVGLGYFCDNPSNPFGDGTGTNIILQSIPQSEDPFASPVIPIPTSSQGFTYSATTAPVLSTDPSQAKPIGLGTVAEGKGTLNITVKTYRFSDSVDIYFGLYSPEIDPKNIYLLTSGSALQKLSEGIVPWKANITGPVNESLFGDIQTSSLPEGTYYLYVLVTPTGNLHSYYLWGTSFVVKRSPTISGNYTLTMSFSFSLGDEYNFETKDDPDWSVRQNGSNVTVSRTYSSTYSSILRGTFDGSTLSVAADPEFKFVYLPHFYAEVGSYGEFLMQGSLDKSNNIIGTVSGTFWKICPFQLLGDYCWIGPTSVEGSFTLTKLPN